MEVINETGLKLVVAPVEEPSHSAALVLVKGTFLLVPDGRCTPVPEAEQRDPSGDQLHKDQIGRTPSWVTDYAPFKPHTDCFVFGAAHAPGGEPTPAFRAGFRVGPVVKDVQLFGPRHWHETHALSKPIPVATVPLRWELSAGGLDDPANPYGLGQDAEPDGTVHLPQIEDANNLITRPGDPRPPVNLAPVPAWFAERIAKTGTRDRRWQLFRAPDPPLDFDPSFHNAAPFDQQAGNYPRGDEPVTLANLHPSVPMLNTALPGLRPRVVAVRTDGSAEELTMRLDTVILLPDDDQLVLLWRALLPVADRSLRDVALVHATIEARDDPARPAADLVAAAKARTTAAEPPPDLAKLEQDGAAEVRTILAKVDLPPSVRAIVDTETNPLTLFETLASHLKTELTRRGH